MALPVRASQAGPGSALPSRSRSAAVVRIRPAKTTTPDTGAIAACFFQAFSIEPRLGTSSPGSSATASGDSGVRGAIGGGFFPPRSLEEWHEQVSLALQAKQDVAHASRQRRLERQEEEQLGGGWARYSAKERQQAERWRRQRSFVVLVAEDMASGELLGCAAVSLAQPEAALPPPFPTSKPRRMYVSNIAVLPQHRRQGVGTALLRRCERQARLWRQDSLWLHVELHNRAALRLYGRLGYQQVARDPMFTPNRRCLMRKEVELLQCSSRSGASGYSARAGGAGAGVRTGAAPLNGSSGSSGVGAQSGGGSGDGAGRRPSSGVFVWSDLELGSAAPPAEQDGGLEGEEAPHGPPAP